MHHEQVDDGFQEILQGIAEGEGEGQNQGGASQPRLVQVHLQSSSPSESKPPVCCTKELYDGEELVVQRMTLACQQGPVTDAERSHIFVLRLVASNA